MHWYVLKLIMCSDQISNKYRYHYGWDKRLVVQFEATQKADNATTLVTSKQVIADKEMPQSNIVTSCEEGLAGLSRLMKPWLM